MPTCQKRNLPSGIFSATNQNIAMKQPRRFFAVFCGSALLACTLILPHPAPAQADLLPPPNTLPAPQSAAAAPRVAPAPAPIVAPAAAQNPAAALIPNRAPEDPALGALLAEVVQQQAKLAENQKLIDEKLAIIAENLRIARIYVSRAK